MDVKQIVNDMTDKEIHEMRVADKDQDALFTADPSKGELMSADQRVDGDEEDLVLDDNDQFNRSGDESLHELIKDPYTKKKQMMTP